jgi:hypothetical protein
MPPMGEGSAPGPCLAMASQVALGEAVAAITMPRHPLYSQ